MFKTILKFDWTRTSVVLLYCCHYARYPVIPLDLYCCCTNLSLRISFANFLWQSTMLQGIERYLKQAIVDKNASVSSASLVSALVSISSFLKI